MWDLGFKASLLTKSHLPLPRSKCEHSAEIFLSLHHSGYSSTLCCSNGHCIKDLLQCTMSAAQSTMSTGCNTLSTEHCKFNTSYSTSLKMEHSLSNAVTLPAESVQLGWCSIPYLAFPRQSILRRPSHTPPLQIQCIQASLHSSPPQKTAFKTNPKNYSISKKALFCHFML